MITLVVEIKPSVLSGRVTAPPSKSFAHRALICAALCEGETKYERQTKKYKLVIQKELSEWI